ncbi:helix-turn-helix domain-containing protein [Daejeonella sp.]|uniref:helix-turn-helix domain-containing protein n=1 Tax=Daejeonella sp. TaxID=2805397 RepID=UPI0030BE5D49
MKNMYLADKIKTLRTKAGMSQEQLAERSQLSLRTVQRIENGETTARGDTLKRIAAALDIPAGEFLEYSDGGNNRLIGLVNVSALSFLVFPFLGFIIPFLIWSLNRHKVQELTPAAHKVLNFQITWTFLLVFIFNFQLWFPSNLNIVNLGRTEMMLLSIFGLYVLNLVLILINTTRSFSGKRVFYQPAITFFKQGRAM